jgi:predicted nucleic acid-binding Zn ribbon protein
MPEEGHMFCSNCGTQIKETDKFCGNCGAQSGAPARPAPAPTQEAPRAPVYSESPKPTQPKKKGKMPLWVKIVLGIVVFVVLMVWLGMAATAGVAKAVDKHLAFLRQNDLRAAYDQTTASDFRGATSFEQFAGIIRRFPGLFNNKSISIVERSVNANGTGMIRAKLVARDGSINKIIYTLVKENGQWKILNFSVNPSNF